MRKLTILALFVVMAALSGCDYEKSADGKQADATKILMAEADRQVGMPNITRFTQKKLMKMIQEECDRENLICYAYLKSDYTGELVFVGKCIGYGIPFSAQFTNPERIADSYQGGYAILPQPDPNGLFMPSSASATWLLMVDPQSGKPRVAYFEPEIVVSPFPLHGAK